MSLLPKSIVLLCLAALCLAALTPVASLLLWAIFLPVCLVFSLAVVFGDITDAEEEPSQPKSRLLVPARAPPALS